MRVVQLLPLLAVAAAAQWSLVNVAADAAVSQHYGKTVSVSGSSLAIGSSLGAYWTTCTTSAISGLACSSPALVANTSTFGSPVALSGSLLVVGGGTTGSGGSAIAAVLLLACGPATCTEGLTIDESAVTASPSILDHFGYSIAVDGSIVVIGAEGTSPGAQGAAYVFWCPTATHCTNWTLLSPPGLVPGDSFGYSVAVSGSAVLVGAPGSQGGIGAAFLFSCSSTTFTCVAAPTLQAPSALGSGALGSSVALYGPSPLLLLVGAPAATVGANANQGAVLAYSCPTPSSCSNGTLLTASDGAANDAFGTSVATSIGVVLVGASNANSDAGAVYLFQCNASTTVGQAPACAVEAPGRITPSGGAASDLFGGHVAINGHLGVAGAVGRGTAYAIVGPALPATPTTSSAPTSAPSITPTPTHSGAPSIGRAGLITVVLFNVLCIMSFNHAS